MRRTTALVPAGAVTVLLALSATGLPAQASPTATTAAGTTAKHLTALVRHELSGSTAGHADFRLTVQGVGTVGSGGTRLTAPASNEKLLTTVTLLAEVGSGFHYRTRVLTHGPTTGHTLHGDLVLRGSGDPTLTGGDLTKLAGRVHAAGIHTVTGHLVVDDTRYSRRTVTTGWKRSFVPEETGRVDAFTVDRNTWRSGASFDSDPTADNAARWRSALHRAHVSVSRSTRIGHESGTLAPLVAHASGPLSEIVAETLTNSDNFAAEMMFREAGARRDGRGTLAGGISAVHAEARALHVSLGRVLDGSGLSYDDRESPTRLLSWLQAARRLSLYPTLHAGLAVSCRTGTLADRLCGHDLTGRIHAKTGTLDGVRALSGYTSTTSGRRVTFSFLLDGISDMTAAQRHLDAAVAAVVRHG